MLFDSVVGLAGMLVVASLDHWIVDLVVWALSHVGDSVSALIVVFVADVAVHWVVSTQSSDTVDGNCFLADVEGLQIGVRAEMVRGATFTSGHQTVEIESLWA